LLKDATGDLANALGDRVAWGSSDVQSGAGRTEIWKQAVDVASDYYFIGGGLSGFMQATNKRTIFHLSRWPGGSGAGAHNLFLEVLVECGPTSLLLLSACLVAVIVVLFRRAAAANRELSSHGILYSLLFVLVCGFFRGLMASPDLWMVLAFATAFAWRGYSFAKVQCLPLQGTGLRDSNAGSVPGCGAFKTYLRELPHARTAANASGR
jgi:O-antigen ligase